LSYLPFAISTVAAVALGLVVLKVYRIQKVKLDVDRVRLMDMLNQWQGPPELVSIPPPRTVKYTAAAKGLLAVLALIIAGMTALVLFIFMPRIQEQSRRDALLRQESVEMSGIVIRTWTTSGDKGSRSYHVAYQYSVGRAIYHAEAQVPSSVYRKLAPNSSVRLRYVPSQPEISALDGEVHQPAWIVLFAFLPLAVIVTIPLTLLKERKLLESGQAVGAVVTGVAPVKGGKRVSYQFLDSAGNTISGSVSRSSNVPELGSTVTALYDPGKSRRNMLYPAKFVRLSNPFRP